MPIHEMWNIAREASLAVSGPIKMAWVCWVAGGVLLFLARDTVRRLARGSDESGGAAVTPRRPPLRRAGTPPARLTRGGAAGIALTPIASSPHVPSSQP